MGREVRRVPANWQHPKDELTGRYKPLHLGDRWPEVMADLGTALQLHMKTTGETNAINAALPIAKKMSEAGENPMIFIAVATELANTPNVKVRGDAPLYGAASLSTAGLAGTEEI